MDRQKKEKEKQDHIAILLQERKRIIYNLVLVGTASFVVLIGMLTMAWFVMNNESGNSGMGIKTKGMRFDIVTRSDDSTARRTGLYYAPFHNVIQEGEGEEFEVWLVDGNSNMMNYSNTGVDDGSFGIEPGSKGVIRFYVIPYEDVNVKFSIQTTGYVAQTTTDGTTEAVTMTKLSSASGNPACFLNGHILLFEDQDKTSLCYSDLIPTDDNGVREFSRYFGFSGEHDVDLDGDDHKEAYEVDIYWIWPETLDTLVYNPSSTAVLICDKNAAVQDEPNDYHKVINNICTYPQYYLNGYNATTNYTEDLIMGKNAWYNDADQEIGMNVDYVLLRLAAEAASLN